MNVRSSAHPTNGVLLFDCDQMIATGRLQPHRGPVTVLALSSTGHLLATASAKVLSCTFATGVTVQGTVVRVFSLPSCSRLYKLRRGASRVSIKGLLFRDQSETLMLWSNSGGVEPCSDDPDAADTIHIWKLDSDRVQKRAEASKHEQWGGAGLILVLRCTETCPSCWSRVGPSARSDSRERTLPESGSSSTPNPTTTQRWWALGGGVGNAGRSTWCRCRRTRLCTSTPSSTRMATSRLTTIGAPRDRRRQLMHTVC